MKTVEIKSEPAPNIIALGYQGADGAIIVTMF